MKPVVVVAIILAAVAFIGAVVWTTLQACQVTCEVCLVFEGQEVCRQGRGPSQAEALASAQQSSCGGNTSGMAESIACLSRAPDRASCSAP
jgi:hypothetical protein